MKKFLMFLCAMVLVFGVVGISNAALIDLGIFRDDKGTQAIYDDQYWIKDLNRFVGMTYDEQITAISNLDNQGLCCITNWRMATYTDILTLWNSYEIQEIAESFVPTTVGLPGEEDYRHWKGRYDRALLDIYHYEVNMSYRNGNWNGGINVGVADREVFPGAFVTADVCSANPVPEPSTMILLGTGLIGLAGWGRRKFKKNVG